MMKCYICEKEATQIHFSLMGSVPYHVCDYHYENTYPSMSLDNKNGITGMGLMDKNTNEYILFNQII